MNLQAVVSRQQNGSVVHYVQVIGHSFVVIEGVVPTGIRLPSWVAVIDVIHPVLGGENRVTASFNRALENAHNTFYSTWLSNPSGFWYLQYIFKNEIVSDGMPMDVVGQTNGLVSIVVSR